MIIFYFIAFQYRNNRYKDDNCKDDGYICTEGLQAIESQQPQKKTNIYEVLKVTSGLRGKYPRQNKMAIETQMVRVATGYVHTPVVFHCTLSSYPVHSLIQWRVGFCKYYSEGDDFPCQCMEPYTKRN